MSDFWTVVCHLWPVLLFIVVVLGIMIFIDRTDPYPNFGDDEERDGRGSGDW